MAVEECDATGDAMKYNAGTQKLFIERPFFAILCFNEVSN